MTISLYKKRITKSRTFVLKIEVIGYNIEKNKGALKVVIIDLFSGAGGLSEGFHQMNCRFAAKIEKEAWACETLKTRMIYHFLRKKNDLGTYFQYLIDSDNHKKIQEHRKPIYKKYPGLEEYLDQMVLNRKFGNPNNDKDATSTSEMIKEIETSLRFQGVNNVDLIIGGPPCQAYSLVGRGRMKNLARKDPRNYLFYYYLSVLEHFKPRMCIFENVPGILTAKQGKVYETIWNEFDRIGYNLMSGQNKDDRKNVIDFAEYGVPQTRKRVLLFGFQKGLDYSYPDYGRYRFYWGKPLTTRDLLYDLPILEPGKGSDYFFGGYTGKADSNYQKRIRDNSIGILNHKARPVREQDRKIYEIAIQKSEKGEQLHYDELPEDLKSHNNRQIFTDRFKVHRENGLPHTVVAHISKDGHYNIHPDRHQCRSLTVREAARIQTFPDNFKFEGPRTAQYVQVGNAVPPFMSEIIARSLGDLIRWKDV